MSDKFIKILVLAGVIVAAFFLYRKKRKSIGNDTPVTNDTSFKTQTGITLTTSSVSDLQLGFKYTVEDIEEFHECINAEQRSAENMPSDAELEFVAQQVMTEKVVQKDINAKNLDDFIERMIVRSKKRKRKKEDTNNDSDSSGGMGEDLSAQFNTYTKQIEDDLAKLNLNWDSPE